MMSAFSPLRLPLIGVALLATLALPACQTAQPAAKPNPPLLTVAHVDVTRYAGTWHEVSRLPNRFQKSCVRSLAEYTALPDGTLSVKNTCYKTKGRTSSVTGIATPVAGSGNAKLKIRFNGLASLAPVPEEGNYWILAVDPSYTHALVGTPDRRFLWMLGRQPTLPFPTYRKLKQKAQDLGFDVSKLIPESTAPPGLVDLRKKAAVSS